MAQSPLKDSTQPVDSEDEGPSSTTDRQWRTEKKLDHECWAGQTLAVFVNNKGAKLSSHHPADSSLGLEDPLSGMATSCSKLQKESAHLLGLFILVWIKYLCSLPLVRVK